MGVVIAHLARRQTSLRRKQTSLRDKNECLALFRTPLYCSCVVTIDWSAFQLSPQTKSAPTIIQGSLYSLTDYTVETELRLATVPAPTSCSARENQPRDFDQTAAKHHVLACYVCDISKPSRMRLNLSLRSVTGCKHQIYFTPISCMAKAVPYFDPSSRLYAIMPCHVVSTYLLTISNSLLVNQTSCLCAFWNLFYIYQKTSAK